MTEDKHYLDEIEEGIGHAIATAKVEVDYFVIAQLLESLSKKALACYADVGFDNLDEEGGS